MLRLDCTFGGLGSVAASKPPSRFRGKHKVCFPKPSWKQPEAPLRLVVVALTRASRFANVLRYDRAIGSLTVYKSIFSGKGTKPSCSTASSRSGYLVVRGSITTCMFKESLTIYYSFDSR